MLYSTIMLLYSFTADRAVYAITLPRPPIQRAHAVAKAPSASPGPSLADIQSSLKLIQTSLQLIETTQADQGASLKRTGNWVISATITVPLASCSPLRRSLPRPSASTSLQPWSCARSRARRPLLPLQSFA